MSDGMLLQIRDDGRAELYDDTYDITIHCSSQEEQDAVRVLLKRAGAIPHWVSQDDIPRWIPFSERLPEGAEPVLVSFCEDAKVFRRVKIFPPKIVKKEYERGNAEAWMPLPEPYSG